MRGHKQITSRASDEYGTPLDFYNWLDGIFQFTLDPCTTALFAKCAKYYTKEDDGLAQSWKGERVFVNPPYSQNYKWMQKAFTEWKENNTLVVVLVPSRTDVRWYHDFCHGKATFIWHIKGRIQFIGGKSGATFPSAVIGYLPRFEK